MDRLKTQAAKLWQLLFAQETTATYQQTLTLTGQILKESGLLLWLTICLILVLFEWFYKSATQAGQNARAWINHQQAEDASPDRIATGLGKALLTASQNSVAYTLMQAREQLGLPIETQPLLAPATPVASPVPTANAAIIAPAAAVPPKLED